MRGLADRVVCEVLLGLQQRCRLDGVKTKDSDLRVFVEHLRRQQVARLEDYVRAGPTVGTLPALVTAVSTHSRRAQSSTEDEVGKDIWDLALFGHSGMLDFTGIRQKLAAAGREAVGGRRLAPPSGPSRPPHQFGPGRAPPRRLPDPPLARPRPAR
ncbi:hypothetical protein AB0G85_36225 [Streptomyces sioyaensis]|uniref:hypothetical protein n=1 Tax=Streptomyces sioyaensis TaxID=67364 RepID=UPI0033EFEE06